MTSSDFIDETPELFGPVSRFDPENPPLKLRIPVACDWCGRFVDEVYPDNNTIRGKKINKLCDLCFIALEPDDVDEFEDGSGVVNQ